jgi:predicted secreted protein
MISLDATFNRRVVRAAVGELLRLELPENISAGNRWSLPDPLPRQLRLVLDKTASDRCLSYTAGERRLEFRVVASGSFALSLINSRAWQQPSTSFEVYIDACDPDGDLRAGPVSSSA